MKILVLLTISISTLTFLAVQRSSNSHLIYTHGLKIKNNAGPNAGFTGAPGEATCIQCHSGNLQTGDTENAFEVSQNGNETFIYQPSQTYDLTLMMTSQPAKKGFQITALNGNNEPAGEFIASTNTQLKSGQFGAIAGRKYATHTSGTNSPNGWDFSWTAPSTNVGEVTFYVATNKANANNQSSGDLIYLSQYTLNSTTGIVEQTKLNEKFTLGYSPSNHQLAINFEIKNMGEMHLNLTDLNGRIVYKQELGKSVEGENKQLVILPNSLLSGIYIVNFFVDNKAMAGKIQISK